MRIFVAGTDTNVGKTVICSWLCLNSGYHYFKPIQSGSIEGTDTNMVKELARVPVFSECYVYKTPVSPHLAARLENSHISIKNIRLPNASNLIVEGAGGLYVPLNDKEFILDLIQFLNIPVVLVARSGLGTINHTLLSLQVLRLSKIPVLGVILNGDYNEDNKIAIEKYGNTRVLACFPFRKDVTFSSLKNIPLTNELKSLLCGCNC